MLDQAGRKAAVIRRAVAAASLILQASRADRRLSDYRLSYTALIGRKNPLSSLRIAV